MTPASGAAPTAAPTTVTVTTTVAAAPPPPAAPVLAEGRTDLPDSVFAVRTGRTVVVYFDTSPMRTRRADKFDHIVRQTLRAVYGPIADTLLAAIPDGKLAKPKALLTSLPSRGIHLPLKDGWTLSLWPETRPGRDGLLIVSYRTLVDR